MPFEPGLDLLNSVALAQWLRSLFRNINAVLSLLRVIRPKAQAALETPAIGQTGAGCCVF